METISPTTEVSLSTGEKITVALPAPVVIGACGQAHQQGSVFITFPQIVGDVQVSLAHIVSVKAKLQ
jgi:hypothetical protein